jgi:uncharacterized membrane protein
MAKMQERWEADDLRLDADRAAERRAREVAGAGFLRLVWIVGCGIVLGNALWAGVSFVVSYTVATFGPQ